MTQKELRDTIKTLRTRRYSGNDDSEIFFVSRHVYGGLEYYLVWDFTLIVPVALYSKDDNWTSTLLGCGFPTSTGYILVPESFHISQVLEENNIANDGKNATYKEMIGWFKNEC
jgi:hypothetical protein